MPANTETGLRRIDAIFPAAIRTSYREKEMQIGYAGSLFQLVEAVNPLRPYVNALASNKGIYDPQRETRLAQDPLCQ